MADIHIAKEAVRGTHRVVRRDRMNALESTDCIELLRNSLQD